MRIGGSGAVSAGPLIANPPATETIAAAAVITADACGVDTAGTITLDANAKFKVPLGVDIALGPDDAVRVCSNGTNWYQISAASTNQ